MRVLLFGASGGIGSQVRRLALAAGHELVLFARDPSALEPLASAERAIQGDIADADSVEQAVSGVDAVVSALGPSANSADQVALFEAFAQALVAAMKRHGARRLVTISGAAVDVPGEHKGLAGRLASAFVRLAVRHVVAAKQREFQIIAASDLEWIAPRPKRVVPGGVKISYRVGPLASGMTIGQASAAAFMVDALSDDTYLRQAPIISD